MGSSAEASGYFLWLVRKTSPLLRACLLKCPAETVPSGRADCFNFLNQAGSKDLLSGGGNGEGGEMLVRISEFKNPIASLKNCWPLEEILYRTQSIN